MKIAYLIDRESIGGGMEYIRRKMAEHPLDECHCFVSSRGECTAKKMNRFEADVIVVNHLRALLQLFRNPFVTPRGRVVCVIHGIHLRKYDFLPRTLRNRLQRFLRLHLEKKLYSKADEIIALNTDDVQMLRDVYQIEKPIRLEPNRIPPADADNKVSSGEASYAFIMVARFDFIKGQDILLAAIAEAQHELRAMQKRTLFIGSGKTLARMRKFVCKNGISDLVRFAGEMPDAAGKMSMGRVLVAPSRWEGCSYSVLEALAQKKYVVASDCPGNKDLIQNGVNGWLFPVENIGELAKLLIRI